MKKKILKALVITAVVVSVMVLLPKQVSSSVVAVNEIVSLDDEPDLDSFALEIQKFEGYYEGSLSYRNNNPGNLRYSSLQTGKKDGFAYFETYDDGFNALINYLGNICENKSNIYTPEMTLEEFFHVYAPPSDNNNSSYYASVVTDNLGVDDEHQIKEFC